MDIQGRVQNGVVILPGDICLPEGAAVTVVYPRAATSEAGDAPMAKERRIEVPLICSDRPGTVNLTNERIAELLDEEDASA